MTNIDKKSTRLIHSGRDKKMSSGSVNPVIQRASSILFDSIEEKKQAILNRHKHTLYYGRRGTLTHFALQQTMIELEGGAGCYLYPSGAAAISNAILAFVKSGDHILVGSSCYEPTQDFCHKILKKLDITTTFYDPMLGKDITQLINENTRVLFLEAPGSITMEIPDLKGIISAVRSVNPEIIIMIDNTWSAGLFFKALEHDIDISLQAGTKYLVGHSDAMIGTAVANTRCWEQLREHSQTMGQIVDADTAYLTARGIRTLATRLKQHQQSAMEIANWLSKQPLVKTVYHPAFPSCHGHKFFVRDFTGASGLFSFELKQKLSQKQFEHFMDHFKLFGIAYSWGGYESLILAYQPEEIAKMRPNTDRKITGTLIRLHIGLEAVEDLIADLQSGFERINSCI